MMNPAEIYTQVEKNIDALVDNGVDFSVPVTHEQIQAYKATRKCDFMPPPEWLPENISGMKLLLLAGAGGQQAPLFAALGADVTVLDLSGKMLAQDKRVAQRENLRITLEKGNMCDLSRFGDGLFDMVVNPASLFYVPDVIPVFRECHRVLKRGGIFIASLANPVNYMCNFDPEKGVYTVCNPLPFVSHEHDEGCAESGWVEYGHTWDSYIGGQTRCGFVITGCIERYDAANPCDCALETRAVKQDAARVSAFEDAYAALMRSQAQIPAELEALRKQGKEKTVKFKELMAQKLVNNHIMMFFEGFGLKLGGEN